jgi:cell division protein FtsW (lipid II flippase)
MSSALPSSFSRALPAGVVEFLLLLTAVAFLAWVGGDLQAGQVLAGRGGRYALALASENAAIQDLAARTCWLLQHCGAFLGAVALAGWAVLTVGRRNPWSLFHALFAVTVWGAVATAVWYQLWLALLPALLLAVVALWISAGKSRQNWLIPAYPAIYPLFTLLTGLGLLWLLSFASMSAETVYNRDVGGVHEERLWFGYKQAIYLFAAHALLTTLARWVNPLLSWGLAGMTAGGRGWNAIRLLRIGWLGMLMLAILAGTMVFAWLSDARTTNGKLQALVWLSGIPLLAWCFIRFRDGSDFKRFLKQVAVIVVFMFSPFAIAKDFGQIMILGAALLAWSLGLWGLMRNRRMLLVSLAALVGLMLTAIFLAHFHEWLPESLLEWKVFHHLEERIVTVENPYRGKEYLSIIRWFTRDAPAGGFGLAKVPWCGTLDELNPPRKNLGVEKDSCRGMAMQTAYDYVFPALIGVWGDFPAWIIVALTACYLLALCHRAPLPDTHRYAHAQRFGDWMARIFAAFSLVQLFITVLGNGGIMVLSGLSFPLLSYGGSLLWMTAVFGSLSVSTCQAPR